MNFPWITAVCALLTGAMLWLGLLWLSSRLKMKRRQRGTKALFGVAAVALLFVPVGELPLWSRVFSFYPNPSLPMLGLVCATLWQRLLGVEVLKPADWTAAWAFGAVIGSLLYVYPGLGGGADLYYWGWERDIAAWTFAALAAGYLAWGNRHGVLLLGALVAYGLNALESRNGWDYAMDPFYWLLSLAVLGNRLRLRVASRLGAGSQAVMIEAVDNGRATVNPCTKP